MNRKEEFKAKWARRRFRCKITGEEFVIPDDVYETAFYSFGECYIDVGRLNAYCRYLGSVEEIKE